MKMKQLLAAALLFCSAGAWAQTDVTSTYITNADFSSTDGWTKYVSAEYNDLGNGKIGEYTVRFSPATVDDTHLATEYCFGFECRWETNYASYNQALSNLPAGVYTLTFDVENVNGSTRNVSYNNLFYVQVGETKYTDNATEWMKGKSSWTTHTINFTMEEAGNATISFGYGTGSNNLGANNTPAIYVSHLKLTYQSLLDGVKALWQEAKSAAEAAVADEAYANVTGEELTAINTEIAKSEPTTKEGYEEATAALETATKTFTAAKDAYDGLVTLWNNGVPELVYALQEKYLAIGDAYFGEGDVVNAEDALARTAAMKTAIRAYYESHALAEGVTGAVNMTDQIANNDATDGNNSWTWSGSKNSPRNTESWTDSEGKNDYMYFDGGNWNSDSWTTTMKQTITVPAGKYLLTAKGRAATNTTLTMAVGEVSVELPHVGNAGNVFDRGWGDASLEFETKGRGDEIVVTATSSTEHEWFSISDFRLVQLENHAAAVAAENLAAALTDAQAALTASSELLTAIAIEAGEITAPQYVPNASFAKGSEYTNLTTAIAAAQALATSTDVDAVIAATETLDAATTAYLEAVPAYERASLVIVLAKVAKELTGAGEQTTAIIINAMKAELADETNTAANIGEKANAQITSLMNSAIIYQSHVIGFEVGQYAPYTNAEGLQLAETAKAMGTTPTDYTNQAIYEQALAMANCTWTVNTEEMDAFFDGDFALEEVKEASSATQLKGWAEYAGIRQILKTLETFPGLADASAGTAVFGWGNNTFSYGTETGYTMPLKENTLYKLTFKVAGWNGETRGPVTVSVLNGEDGLAATNVGTPQKDIKGLNAEAGLTSFTQYFTTGAAGNYIFSIRSTNNIVFTDLSLKPAVVEDITIDENADYTPAETYANITLARSIKADTWNTFVVPFDITNEELVAAFGDDVAVAEFSENSEDASAVTVNFNKMDTPAITANTPVLLKGNAGTSFTFNGKITQTGDAKVAGTNVDFVGTYAASTTVKAGDYFISGNKLWKSEGATTIQGTRAYIDAKVPVDVKLFIDGLETAISEINTDATENGVIYNIAGQRVNKAQKGIYIVNGKKAIVK